MAPGNPRRTARKFAVLAMRVTRLHRPRMANTFVRVRRRHKDRRLVRNDPRACTHICIREFHNCLLPLLVKPAGEATSLTSIIIYRQSLCAPKQATSPGVARANVFAPHGLAPGIAYHLAGRTPGGGRTLPFWDETVRNGVKPPAFSRRGGAGPRISTVECAADRAATSAIACGAMIRLYCLVPNEGTIPAVVYHGQRFQDLAQRAV